MGTNRMPLNRGVQLLNTVAHWPPLVYVFIGLALGALWALGTSVQVLTSEAWLMNRPLREVNFTAFGQLEQALTGQLPPDMLIPVIFGWGVQFALIVASIGIELPKHPWWRYYLSWAVVILLIGVNSAGDFASSSQYGVWGQWGFTLVILFVTFCMSLFAIMAFIHAWNLMRKTPA